MSDEKNENPFKMPEYSPPESEIEEDIVTTDIARTIEQEAQDAISIIDEGGERKNIRYIPNDGDKTSLDLAIALVAAEEGARLTTQGFARSLFELRHSFSPSVTVSAPSGEGAPRTVWATRKVEVKDWTVNGSYTALDILGKAGVIVDFIIICASSDFKVTVNIDGIDLYDDSYTNLSVLTRSDTNLSAYRHTTTNNYIVAIHNVYFAYEVKLIIGADAVEFEQVRINFNTEYTG